jgi:tetrathionate reductase subunit B
MQRQRLGRREFLAGSGLVFVGVVLGQEKKPPEGLVRCAGFPAHARFAYLVDTTKCIGCGNCVRACRAENNVAHRAKEGEHAPAANEGLRAKLERFLYTPAEKAENDAEQPTRFRTWVERYLHIETEKGVSVRVDSPEGGEHGYPPVAEKVLQGFFVPKLCNHCAHPSCVKVCPTSATFSTPEGVVLVDDKRCVGCCYCIQACPYGMRHLDRRFGRGVAEKCTWCYHRITKDLKPACVTACPSGARRFGVLSNAEDPVTAYIRANRVYTIRPETGNDPQVRYTQLGREVL